MRKKIHLVILLMSLCTLLLLGLQLYWNYQSFKNNVRVFKSDISDALDKAVAAQTNLKRDHFAEQYKRWLADTSFITISVRYSDSTKSNIFSVKDTHPPFSNRPPFSISLNDLKNSIAKLSPELKTRFVASFVKNVVSRDLRSGSAYYYTQKLGDSLVAAFRKDRLDLPLLKQLYQKELAERDIYSEPVFHRTIYKFKGFKADAAQVSGQTNTRSFKYGFSSPMWAISASFPDADLVFLEKMKWVLIASFLLMLITISCYTFTVWTMLSQKKLSELKDDFVNNMTHELKTPVATISIAAEAIQDFRVNPATAEEYLGIIRYQSGNLSHLIDQLMQSILNGQQEAQLKQDPVSLTAILQHCLQQYQPRLLATGTSLTADLSAVEITGDAAHLSNVIANLIDNAIKYGTQPPVIAVSLKQEKQAVLAVSNVGAPIPAGYQSKVFERFFRVPAGDIHDVKGYGLGLSYVKDIVQKHGGHIEVRTTATTNTFIIYLPRS